MRFSELAVKEALKAGATEAEVYVQRGKSIRVEFAEKIETFKTTESVGLSVRVALGKKVAMYSTSTFNDAEVREAVVKAVKIAKVSPEDPDWNSINKKFGKTRVEKCFDAMVDNIEYEEVVDRLGSAVELMMEHDKRVKPTRGLLTLASANIAIATSHDESLERKETGVSVWVRAKAKDSGLESTGNEHQEARGWKNIDFENLAVTAASKAVRFLKAKPVKSGKADLIVRNQIFANLLGVFMAHAASADWIQKGRSPLAGKLGKKIASDRITIIDNGTMPGGWGTRPSDDEGCPIQKTPIIENGVLQNYLYDSYTAFKEGLESTGNGLRPGYWLKPQPAPNNLVFEAGDVASEEMIHDTKEGIYVDTTIGEWLSNPVSGNLNATVTHGNRVKNGELTEPVKGAVISGNFYELIRNGVVGIGKDMGNSGEDYAPSVKLSNVTIAGE